MINTINSIQYPLAIMSVLGILLLHRNKRLLLLILSIIFFSLLWRSLFKINSRRYYAAIIFYGIFLSVYTTCMISRTKKKLIFFSIVAATLTYNCIKTFNSFKDIYIYLIFRKRFKESKASLSKRAYTSTQKSFKDYPAIRKNAISFQRKVKTLTIFI